MNKLMTIWGCIFFLCNALYSQSSFLERGNSGLQVGGNFAINSDVTGVFGNLSYSSNGMADFGIMFGQATTNTEFDDLSALAIAPFVSAFLVKQERGVSPFSIALSGGYELDLIQSDVFDALNISASSNSYGGGLSILSNIYNDNVILQPAFSVSYFYTNLTLKDNNTNESLSEADGVFTFGGGLGLGFTSPSSVVAISPGVAFSEGTATFRISLDFIFSSSQGSTYPVRESNYAADNRRRNRNLDLLFDESEYVFLNIEKVQGSYFLVTMQNNSLMRVGETCEIVRKNGRSTNVIGYGRVVKIQGKKVALEAFLDSYTTVNSSTDQVKYILRQ